MMMLGFLPPPRAALGPLPSRRVKRKSKPAPPLAIGQMQRSSATSTVTSMASSSTMGTGVAVIDRTALATAAAWNRTEVETFPHPLDPSLWVSEEHRPLHLCTLNSTSICTTSQCSYSLFFLLGLQFTRITKSSHRNMTGHSWKRTKR